MVVHWVYCMGFLASCTQFTLYYKLIYVCVILIISAIVVLDNCKSTYNKGFVTGYWIKQEKTTNIPIKKTKKSINFLSLFFLKS